MLHVEYSLKLSLSYWLLSLPKLESDVGMHCRKYHDKSSFIEEQNVEEVTRKTVVAIPTPTCALFVYYSIIS
jgi:hypothetical protein